MLTYHPGIVKNGSRYQGFVTIKRNGKNICMIYEDKLRIGKSAAINDSVQLKNDFK